MEKQTNEESSVEENTPLDVSKLSADQIRTGVNRVIEHIAANVVNTVVATEDTIGKRITININATLKDGRKLHIRLRE